MAGRGKAPKEPELRHGRHEPTRGEIVSTPDVGWQHGPVPDPPEGMKPASIEAWRLWFGAWYAAHWSPEDVPALRHLVLLYDQVERGEFQRAGELRLGQDTWGITPKGQQDRRWAAPKSEEPAASTASVSSRRAALKVV